MHERRSGDLGSAAISDVEQIELFFAHTLSPLAVAATVPLATVIALVTFHGALALVFVPALILLATVPSWLRRRAEAQGRDLREALGDTSADVVDTFQGLRELVSFGGGPRRQALLRARGATLRASKVAHGRRSGLELAATDTITIAGVLAVLVTGAALVAGGSLDASWFPVAVVLAAVSLLPVIKVTEVARELNMVAAAADRITTILRAPAPVTDLVDAPPPGPIEPRSVSTRSASVTGRRCARPSPTSASRSPRARPSRSSATPGPASRPAPACCCGCGTSKRGRSRSAATTCATSPRRTCAGC